MPFLGLFDNFRYSFSKKHMSSVEDPGRWVGGPDTFGEYEARRFRCAIYQALYENTAYDTELHSWAGARNTKSGNYKYIRGAYNPCYRLAESFASQVYNGLPDPRAGDGSRVSSAIPIVTENEAIRRPIARLWRDSNWGVNKSIYVRTGTINGDAPIILVDDVVKGRIVMEVLDPACLRWVGPDLMGNVRSYIRQEYRPNPTFNPAKRFSQQRSIDQGTSVDDRKFVLYTEVCWRDGEDVIYETYRGNGTETQLYNWRGLDRDGNNLPPQWTAPYGFVPMVVNPHIKVKANDFWGHSELGALLLKVDEANDLGSKLHDQIRKVVEGMWFMAGVRPPDPNKKTVVEGEATVTDPQPGRQEMKVVYSPQVGATATPLVIPLDIQFASIEIMNQVQELERDSPVLRFDRLRATGDASAKALREARKPAEGSIQERRAGYDDTLARAHKMAISMGRMREYPEYTDGIPIDAYEDGKLDHHIGFRTAFGVDPMDAAELETSKANSVAIWVGAGVPLSLALKRSGWTEDQMEEFEVARKAEDEIEAEKAEHAATLATKAKPVSQPNGELVAPVIS